MATIDQPTGYGAVPLVADEEPLPAMEKLSCCDSCCASFLNFTDRCYPWHKWPVVCGLVCLLSRRNLLNKYNLLPVDAEQSEPLPPKPEELDHRTTSGAYNDLSNPSAGAVKCPFGRNAPGTAPSLRVDSADPDPFLVAQKLLQRRAIGSKPHFKPAGDQFNVIAASWIQAMVHDWIAHTDGPETQMSGGEKYGCPLSSFTFKETGFVTGSDGRPVYPNRRTHWWDLSLVYGQDEATLMAGRVMSGGLLKTEKDGSLVHDPATGAILTGDSQNSWLGVTLLQTLFTLEHNAVAAKIAEAHPDWDDETLFHKARLATSAVAAKIHTIDWTVELLKMPTMDKAMHTNWYGLVGKWLKENTFLGNTGSSAISGLVGLPKAENHGTPYSLTEEFTAVYRLHPMLPDSLKVGDEEIAMQDLVAVKGESQLARLGPEPFWETVTRDPCGNLELYNYPSFLRELEPTTEKGVPLTQKVDLAAIDIFRDRERGVAKYNTVRRALNMNPITKWEDLTDDPDALQGLREVYGEDVERMDLLVGNLAEKKIPGFAISETSFHIFIVMASRRLEADRFFTEYFNAETYSQEGFDWVNSTEGLKDVLARHFPSIAAMIPPGNSAFKPWGV